MSPPAGAGTWPGLPADWIPPETLGRAAVGLARPDQAAAILASDFGLGSLTRMWNNTPPDRATLHAATDPDSPTARLLDRTLLTDDTPLARRIRAELTALRDKPDKAR